MTLETFTVLVLKARQETRSSGERIEALCVTLNRDTYERLWSEIYIIQRISRGHTFLFYGVLISWSPMHEQDRDGHAIGKIWPTS